MACLDEWLIDTKDTRWVFVTGGPGMGKSAILAAWLARREATGNATPASPIATTLVPHHFIRRQVADWDQPEVIAASLAAQIEAAFPALRDASARPQSRLLDLLGRLSKQIDATRPLVLVVDGLDETRAEPGENPLPRFLPHVVPPGIRFLCATRATYPHLRWIEQRSPVRWLDLDSSQWAASNEAVVRGFWQAVAAEYRPPLPAEMVDTAIARADGNVLHAVMLHDTLRDLPAEQRQAHQIPRGLEALIDELWDRASQPEVRAGLSVLCAAQEAISLEMLGKLVEQARLPRWTHDHQQQLVHEARQLLLEERASWNGVDAYRLRHDWVRDVIAARLGEETLRMQHATLARSLATWPPPAGASERRYALRHALTHRLEAGDRMGAWAVAGDLRFLEAKCGEFGVDEAEADVIQLAAHCRARGDEGLGLRAAHLARALARESHWLRGAPDSATALVWNQLRRLGWSIRDLTQRLTIPATANFLRIRYVATNESPMLERNLIGHTEAVTACAVTRDGRCIVSVSHDGALIVWNVVSGQPVANLQAHYKRIKACAITPDGRRTISLSLDGALSVHEIASGQHQNLLLCGHNPERDRIVAITPDGIRAIAISWDNEIKIYNIDAGKIQASLEIHSPPVTACAVTPDFKLLISTSSNTIEIYNLDSGQHVATLEGHTGPVTAFSVDSDNRRVFSTSDDKTIRVWDLASYKLDETLHGHDDAVTACAVTKERLITASSDRTLRVWDLATFTHLATLQGHTGPVTACAITPDGRRVVSASEDNTLKIWNLTIERPAAVLQGHRDFVYAFAVTRNRRRLVSASMDKTIGVWDLESGRPITILHNPYLVPPYHKNSARPFAGTHYNNSARAFAVTPDGRHVVSASEEKTLQTWDLETGEPFVTLQGPSDRVLMFASTPDGRHLFLLDEGLHIWDLTSGGLLGVLQGDIDHVGACVVTANGKRLVSASRHRGIIVWDITSGSPVAALEGHSDRVSDCVLTPDGQRLISASDDKSLVVWDSTSWKPIATMQGHSDGVSACAVTSDGRHLISASIDKTLRVWDLNSYTCVFTHRGNVAYLAVAVTTSAIIAGDAAGSIWNLEWPSSSVSSSKRWQRLRWWQRLQR